MNLALFDFDGTLTTKDSLSEFIQFCVGRPSYYLGLVILSPMLLLYKLKIIPNDIAKERFISHFFKDWSGKKFTQLAQEYSLTEIDKIIRPKALMELQWHQTQGHEFILVSASMQQWLQPWCNKNNIKLVSTQLEIKNDLITGKFSSKNCYGSEKVKQLHDKYDLSLYTKIYAYGDSAGDKDLLKLAHHSYYKPFRKNWDKLDRKNN